MSFLNDWARQSFECAVRRGKTRPGISHKAMVKGIASELKELVTASRKKPSEHVFGMTEETEELVDVMLCCMTELYNRGEDVEAVLWAKLYYNKSRD